MSIIKEASAPCSKCGEKQTVRIYRSINTAENPELKEKVRNGSLFLWECPHCGQMNLARYETLYHDPESKLMVWLLPEGDLSETQMQSITMHTKAMGGYTLRRVTDMGSLMEKVLIREAGLDDVAIEMCKYVTKMEMMSKITGKESQESLIGSKFHFYRCEGEGDDRTITLMFPKDGAMAGVNIGWNVYQDCEGILSRNPQMAPDEGFAMVDSNWLASKMM
ncbi:MAG: CpXC domain-containing protein [Candidatus Cryptobacteroides sp.]